MFFTVITTIISLSLAFSFLKIRKHIKHDTYLYKFCSLRREVMSYLRINHDIISKQEYKATKQILGLINSTINLYSKDQAANLFNFRRFRKFVKSTKDLSDSSRKIIDCDNQTINGFRDKLRRNIVITFFAYTPFLFEEICLRLLYLIGLLLVKIGMLKMSKFGNKLLALNEDFDSISSSKKELLAN